MQRIYNKIKKIEERLSTILLIIIVILVFIGSLLRYIGFPLNWMIDVAQLLFAWVCFLGADILLRLEKHISVDLIYNKLPQTIRKYIKLFNYIFIGLFLLLILVFGVYISIAVNERTFNTLQISYSYATASIPFGSILMLFTIIKKIKAIF